MRIAIILATALSACSAPAGAQTGVPVEPFTSVALRGGGHVVLKPGPEARLTLLEGDARSTRVTVLGGRLVIDNCPGHCPKGYRLRAVATLPEVSSLMVTNGGRIIVEGDFPARPSLGLAVSQGGALDARALEAEVVAASVFSGGRIYTRPLGSLTASVDQGGAITYWGRPRVTKSIHDGGVVQSGAAADLHKTFADLDPPPPPLPPIPPLPDVAGVAQPVPPVPPIPPD